MAGQAWRATLLMASGLFLEQRPSSIRTQAVIIDLSLLFCKSLILNTCMRKSSDTIPGKVFALGYAQLFIIVVDALCETISEKILQAIKTGIHLTQLNER